LTERLAPLVDLYRPAAPFDPAAAAFVGRFDALASEQDKDEPRALTVREAAKRLGCVKADGKISDRFYNTVAPLIGRKVGGRWAPFLVSRVEAFERGEL
jgi:hypothetical protein